MATRPQVDNSIDSVLASAKPGRISALDVRTIHKLVTANTVFQDGDESVVKTMYESNANTNAFTDDQVAKLNTLDDDPNQKLFSGESISSATGLTLEYGLGAETNLPGRPYFYTGNGSSGQQNFNLPDPRGAEQVHEGMFWYITNKGTGDCFINNDDIAGSPRNEFTEVVPSYRLTIGQSAIVYLSGVNVGETVATFDIMFINSPTITFGAFPVTTSITTGEIPNVIYEVTGLTDNTRTITIGASHNLLAGQSQRFFIHNTSNTYWIKIIHSGGNFDDMADDEFWIKPGEIRELISSYDGTNHTVRVIGEVSYLVKGSSALLFGANWTISGDGIPTDLVEVPSGNTDRFTFKVPCTVRDLTFNMEAEYTGTPAANFGALAEATPSVELRKNTVNESVSREGSLLNLGGFKTTMHHPFADVGIAVNDYLDFAGIDVGSITIRDLSVRFKMVLKRD